MVISSFCANPPLTLVGDLTQRCQQLQREKLSDFCNRIKAAPVSTAIHITDVVYEGDPDNTETF